MLYSGGVSGRLGVLLDLRLVRGSVFLRGFNQHVAGALDFSRRSTSCGMVSQIFIFTMVCTIFVDDVLYGQAD